MKEINNNIHESYCSFDMSKLLKEKGFESEFCQCYTEGREFYISPNLLSERITGKKRPETIPAPTHSIAIEWLRVNFDLYIEIKTPDYSDGKWLGEIHKVYGFGNHFNDLKGGYNTPQEATEAALKYVLEELI